MGKIHGLKTDPDVFQKSYQGVKTFEIRFNDRNYEVGDTVILKETKYSRKEMDEGMPLEYTGREGMIKISYILYGPIYGLKEGWVIFC